MERFRSGKADVILGLQFGDEGKGKIVDYLSSNYDVVARFQGGANSGHTILTDKGKVVLRTLPSSVLHPGKVSVLGHGMVVDPRVLVSELQQLKELGVEIGEVVLSAHLHLTMPVHVYLDSVFDALSSVGSTKKGNTPTYAAKIMRIGVRPVDLLGLAGEKLFSEVFSRTKKVCAYFNTELYTSGIESWCAAWMELMSMPISFRNTSSFLNGELRAGKRVLLEAAQGCMLDIEHGTYPDVTSTSIGTASALLGSGVSPKYLGRVYGIIKPYSTRVGTGAFVGELDKESPLCRHILNAGEERGSVTGRERRIAVLDIDGVTDMIELHGVTDVIVTKIDVLDGAPDGISIVNVAGRELSRYDNWSRESGSDVAFLSAVSSEVAKAGASIYLVGTGKGRNDVHLYDTQSKQSDPAKFVLSYKQ